MIVLVIVRITIGNMTCSFQNNAIRSQIGKVILLLRKIDFVIILGCFIGRQVVAIDSASFLFCFGNTFSLWFLCNRSVPVISTNTIIAVIFFLSLSSLAFGFPTVSRLGSQCQEIWIDPRIARTKKIHHVLGHGCQLTVKETVDGSCSGLFRLGILSFATTHRAPTGPTTAVNILIMTRGVADRSTRGNFGETFEVGTKQFASVLSCYVPVPTIPGSRN